MVLAPARRRISSVQPMRFFGSPPLRMTFLFLCLCVSSACEAKEKKGVSPLVKQGKALYMTTCIACHNADPRKPGVLGPEIRGATFGLLKVKIQRGIYPQGYTPKRPTKLMTPLPSITDDQVKAIEAFINSF